MTQIIATGLVRDEGTLVLLSGIDPTELPGEGNVVFAVEHRYADDILTAIDNGEEDVMVDVPDYLIVS